MTPQQALDDVCRRFCIDGRHDDACLALQKQVAVVDRVRHLADDWESNDMAQDRSTILTFAEAAAEIRTSMYERQPSPERLQRIRDRLRGSSFARDLDNE